ncbi:MAG: response regulator, partial [Magnetococcus sp. YQC-3]
MPTTRSVSPPFPCLSFNVEMPESFSSTLYVVDSDASHCDFIAHLFSSVYQPVKTFCSSQIFLSQFQPDQTGCLLLNERMPHISGLELQERLLQMGALLPVIVMSERGDVGTAVRAMKNRAFHVLEKPMDNRPLLEIVQAAIRSDARTRARMRARAAVAQRLERVSAREWEVAKQMTQGKRSKEIATTLAISAKTVEAHRASIMIKTGSRSTVELVRLVWSFQCPCNQWPDHWLPAWGGGGGGG